MPCALLVPCALAFAFVGSCVELTVINTHLIAGRFSDNAFFLTGPRTVQFVPFLPGQLPALQASLRVEHLASYL